MKSEKQFYRLTEDDKKQASQYSCHFTGKNREFIESFCKNIQKLEWLSWKQWCVMRSIRNQIATMYKPTKWDMYDSPTDESQMYDWR